MSTNLLKGRFVRWYPKADRSVDWRPALVTGPAKASREQLLSLTIFGEGFANTVNQKGVRHLDDPKLKTHPRMKNVGGWDYLPIEVAYEEAEPSKPKPEAKSAPPKAPPKDGEKH